jgi:cytochrome c peroxidase
MRRVFSFVLIALAFGGAMVAFGRALMPRGRAGGAPAYALPSPALLHATYVAGLDSLDGALHALADLPPDVDTGTARTAFRRARAAYKRIEYLAELDGAFAARALNRPPVPTVDEDDPRSPVAPTGLQVIEGALYPRLTRRSADVVGREVDYMRGVLRSLRTEPDDTAHATRRAFDAARLEVARVGTLGIAGFDATLSKDGLRESAAALRGVADGLRIYRPAVRARDPGGWETLDRSLRAAATYLEAAPGFDRFDRLAFLSRFLPPIADGLDRFDRALALPPSSSPSAWISGATNIYAAGALDPSFFAPDYAPASSPALVALGKRLFFDPALSRRETRSCASCHQPARAFSDGLAKARVDPGHGTVRNTPTLLNAGIQLFQFADQRAPFLEFQVEAVMQNPREMGLPLAEAVRKLGRDSALVARFADALRTPERQALTPQTVGIAIAAYVRSLQAMDSRFDRAVRGDTAALTAPERRGLNLFFGKAACATCHFPPLFGGALPPTYGESEPEVIGVPATRARRGARVDPDLGVFAIDHAPLHRHAFKTPQLRNVALTAPYMHNGVFRTLKEVVDFYDRGGGAGLGLALPNQTLSPERLHLSGGEKHDLVAFLATLTDSTSVPTSTATDPPH